MSLLTKGTVYRTMYVNKEENAYTYPLILKYLENKIKGTPLSAFFTKHNIKSIAIYGLELGELFYEDIKETPIEIKYFTDKLMYRSFPEGIDGIPVISPARLPAQEPVDAVIVMPVFHINDITDELLAAGFTVDHIIALTDIVYGLSAGVL